MVPRAPPPHLTHAQVPRILTRARERMMQRLLRARCHPLHGHQPTSGVTARRVGRGWCASSCTATKRRSGRRCTRRRSASPSTHSSRAQLRMLRQREWIEKSSRRWRSRPRGDCAASDGLSSRSHRDGLRPSARASQGAAATFRGASRKRRRRDVGGSPAARPRLPALRRRDHRRTAALPRLPALKIDKVTTSRAAPTWCWRRARCSSRST